MTIFAMVDTLYLISLHKQFTYVGIKNNNKIYLFSVESLVKKHYFT